MWTRRSIRLPGHDYRAPAWYFVTICAETRGRRGEGRIGCADSRGEHEIRPGGSRWVFGSVREGLVRLTPAGEMVAAVWSDLARRFDFVQLDAFVVMPDHFHGLLRLEPCSELATIAADEPLRGPPPGSLGQVLQAFKSETTYRYALAVRHSGWPAFRRRLWQRNYHDWVIRDARHLHATRRYIDFNPARWRGG